MKDKRDIIWECLHDRHASADAILNALHQGGWMIVPKHEFVRLADVAEALRGCARPYEGGPASAESSADFVERKFGGDS